MGTFTRNNTELAVDVDGSGQQHRAEAGGMTIALEQWKAGLDTVEWFADLPDGACQESHWGYCLRGRGDHAVHRRSDRATSPLERRTTSGPATTPTSTVTLSSSSSPGPTTPRASTPSSWRRAARASPCSAGPPLTSLWWPHDGGPSGHGQDIAAM